MVWIWIPGKNRHESKSAPPMVALTDPGGLNWGGRERGRADLRWRPAQRGRLSLCAHGGGGGGVRAVGDGARGSRPPDPQTSAGCGTPGLPRRRLHKAAAARKITQAMGLRVWCAYKLFGCWVRRC